MRKTILYIGGFELPDKNAAAQRVVSNAKVLRELGLNVEFIDTTKDIRREIDEFQVEGFKYSSINYPRTKIEWLYHITKFVEEERILKAKPNYIILYNFPAIASIKILSLGKKHKISIIGDVTEWYQEKGISPIHLIKKLDIYIRMHYSLRKMDGLITISRYLYDYYKNSTKTILVPPLVDLDDPKWKRQRVLNMNHKVRLVYAGSPGNGSKDRLDLFVNAVSKYSNMKLRILGISEEEYVTLFGVLSSSIKNVEFLGRRPHHEAINEVCDADFQMIIREINIVTTAGFPTKLAESISSCTPVIANLSSNIGDYLVDGENSFIVSDNQTLDEVLDRISKMSKQDIVKMKENCRKDNSFDFRYYTDIFKEIFIQNVSK